MEIIQPHRISPAFCQYVDGECDQDFSTLGHHSAFFIYPGEPASIAAAIEAAAAAFVDSITWKHLRIEGQTIYCEICKSMRGAATIVADVTTLNFNVMFEVGYAIGLGLPLIPIRDTSYLRDTSLFVELGILDTIGYLDFCNSRELIDALRPALPARPLPTIKLREFEQPVYVLKGRVESEGAIGLNAFLKKSALYFRSYDPIETPRISMGDLRRQVGGSSGVVAHLMSPNRAGAKSHNALCALASGMAMAQEIAVLMIQEENVSQPIDYRDVVKPYTHPSQIPDLVEPLVHEIVRRMQTRRAVPPPQEGLLEKLDFGDPSAENEIGGLRSYFVRTGQFTQAKQGHARLVVGRRGTGKTAIFYGVRDFIRSSQHVTILDLKPEGHQFIRLREAVLQSMTAGLQEHTMTAFWTFVLLTELARKIVYDEDRFAFRDPRRKEIYDAVKEEYSKYSANLGQDFPQRLLHQIDHLNSILQGAPPAEIPGRITNELYSASIRNLGEHITAWLAEKEGCWILVDNIDKGWPTHGAKPEDVIIVKSLLEAVRKIERQFQKREVELNCLVFLRSDIFEQLLRASPDRGKDTPIVLEWNDLETMKQLVTARMSQSLGDQCNSFSTYWDQLFEPLIGSEDSFKYMLNRTLMRPRDLLQFLQRAQEIALNRSHLRVTADDVKQAERSYSEDLLYATAFEIEDTHSEISGLLYRFEGHASEITNEELDRIILAENESGNAEQLIELLMWFSFIGVKTPDAEVYSYDLRHNVSRLMALANTQGNCFVIHPGFRAALTR